MERDPTPYQFMGESLDHWHRQAVTGPTRDEFEPHLATPCSRYGRTAGDVAWYAVAALVVVEDEAGLENQTEAIIELEFCMGWAVNDHPGIAQMLTRSWTVLPEELTEHLASYEEVREMAGEEA